MTDDQTQLGFEIEFDDQTQSWLEWSAPERMESQIRVLLVDAVPGATDDEDAWWQPPVSTRVIAAVVQRFDSWEEFIEPENHPLVDRFVRFLGECCLRRHPGMTWTTSKLTYNPLPELYPDFRPAVHFVDGGVENLLSLAESAFVTQDAGVTEYEINEAGKPA